MGSENGDRPGGQAGSTNGSGPPGDATFLEAPPFVTGAFVTPGPDPTAEPAPSGPAPYPATPAGQVPPYPLGPDPQRYQPVPHQPVPYQPVPYQPVPYQPGWYPTPPQWAKLDTGRRRSPLTTFPVTPPRTHRWGLGAYLLAEGVFIATSLAVSYLAQRFGSPSAGTLALSLAVPTLLAAGLAILITRVRGNGPRIDLGLQWSWRDVAVGLGFGFGGVMVSIPVSIIYVSIVGIDTNSAVGDVFRDVRAGPAMATLVLLLVVFVAPFCEEIVYRGLLWGGVERHGVNRWVTLAVTTLVFALAHFEFARTPVLLVVAIPIGLARLYTGRLLASIVAHQVNNLLPGIVLMLGLLGIVPMA